MITAIVLLLLLLGAIVVLVSGFGIRTETKEELLQQERIRERGRQVKPS